MNAPMDSTRPNARKVSFEVSVDDLAAMKMVELRALLDAVMTVGDVLAGLSCQPRYAGRRPHSYNPAGEVLDRFCEYANSLSSLIVETAESAPLNPADKDSIEWRAWLIMQFRSALADDIGEFSVEAGRLARDCAYANGSTWGTRIGGALR